VSARLSEFELIRRYFERPTRSALLGVGDDAALLRPSPGMTLAVSTDTLNQGVHFAADAAPALLGHKALAVNLSDLAAMGATPRWATLALTLPRTEEAWLADFARGFLGLAERFGVELIGGDTTRGALSMTVTILGEVPEQRALLRSGALPGDDVWVSGALGGAALGLALERRELALPEPSAQAVARRLHQPEPRVALGEALRELANSAIDVSDGFAADLGHVLERSAVAARVEYARLPRDPAFGALRADAAMRELERRCVLAGGDDYELVFTAGEARRAPLEALASRLGVALTRVGTLESGTSGLMLLDERGAPLPVPGGFDHFAGRA
jgi:thiamine-monophosphate kinase